jgi:hypothetical protein
MDTRVKPAYDDGVCCGTALQHPSYPRKRVSSTPRLFDSIISVSGILDRPVKPDDDSRRWRALSFDEAQRIQFSSS